MYENQAAFTLLAKLIEIMNVGAFLTGVISIALYVWVQRKRHEKEYWALIMGIIFIVGAIAMEILINEISWDVVNEFTQVEYHEM